MQAQQFHDQVIPHTQAVEAAVNGNVQNGAPAKTTKAAVNLDAIVLALVVGAEK